MAEVPGARARLVREAEAVCVSLRSLAARLTPGQVPEFTVPDEPFMDTGTEPPTYLHTVSNRVRAQDARPARAAYAPDLAARAVTLLSADGRQATEQIPEPRHASWGVVVTGRRDGREITVSVARDRDQTPFAGPWSRRPVVRPVRRRLTTPVSRPAAASGRSRRSVGR